MTCPDANLIVRLADGELADPERASVEHHLDGCADCARLITELAWLVAPPRDAPPRYRLLRPTRTGWLAYDLDTHRRVALRFVPHLADLRAATVRHPALIPILDLTPFGDEIAIATPVVSDTLFLDWRAPPPALVAAWCTAADAISALHAAGLVHGALSPDHLLVDAPHVVVDGLGAPQPAIYRAVELLHGAAPSPAADQFALAAILWHALAGKPPFTGATPGALAVAMASPLRTPPHLRPLARALSPDPLHRYPDVASLISAVTHPRRWLIAAVLVAATLIGIVAALAS